MRSSGVALMGTGIAEGEGRALRAVEEALISPLLNNNDITGAKNILLNVTSGVDEITMDEIGEITDFVQDKAGFEADLIWGNGIDEELGDKISVTVIATGFSISSIPEMLLAKKPEKQVHYLEDDPILKPNKKTVHVEKEIVDKPKQRTFEFNINQQQETTSEFDALYPKTNREREQGKESSRLKVDFSEYTDEAVDELENVPAYLRKQGKKKINPNDNAERSSISVSKDRFGNVNFGSNNRYLHDNID